MLVLAACASGAATDVDTDRVRAIFEGHEKATANQSFKRFRQIPMLNIIRVTRNFQARLHAVCKKRDMKLF